MPQIVTNRLWMPGISLVLLTALGVFAHVANAQAPYGQPPAGYGGSPDGPTGYDQPSPPGAPRQVAGPSYQQGPQQSQYPIAGQPSYGPPDYAPPQNSYAPAQAPYAQAPNSYVPPQYTPPGAGFPQVAAAPQADPLEDLFTPAKIIARVGNQPILAGDLLGDINQMLEPYADKAPKEELDQQRVVLMRNLLTRLIETKLVYMEFLRTIPPDKLPTVEANLAKAFDEEQLPDMLKRGNVATAAELDAKLRDYGTSLDKQRKRFGEQYLAQMIVRKNVNYEPEITHLEMLAFYQDHADEYAFAATVKWEHLMASFEKHGSEDAAYRAIAAMGNEVVGGAPLAAVAKRSSDAPDAFEGGLNKSTTQGSLVWTDVDATLFSVPLNRLSTIIRSNAGFHIVRVLERQNAGKESFVEAQVAIKEKLKRQKIKAEAEVFLEKVKAGTPVWTIFDDMPAEVAEGQSMQELMRR